MREPKIDLNRMTAEVDISNNCMYIVKDGKVTPIESPCTGYGEYTAVWKDGKVLDVIKKERMRII